VPPSPKGNDRNKTRGGYDPTRKDRSGRGGGRRPAPEGQAWIWGLHPVEAALINPARPTPSRVLASAERAAQFKRSVPREALETLEIVDGAEIARELPQGAVHQGAALLGEPPEPSSIAELAEPAEGLLLMLDQVTDPQNVGAILRSAAAFGVKGVILQDRHAPVLGGALAKAAAGAVDKLAHARVVNLSRALEELEENGWRAIGLAGEAEASLEDVLDARPTCWCWDRRVRAFGGWWPSTATRSGGSTCPAGSKA
jgi:23S rRNA (guanosine2251-2'-O)-methyltransferase